MTQQARSISFALLFIAGTLTGTGCIVSPAEDAEAIEQEFFEPQDENGNAAGEPAGDTNANGEGGAGGQGPSGGCTTISCRGF